MLEMLGRGSHKEGLSQQKKKEGTNMVNLNKENNALCLYAYKESNWD